MSWTELFKKIDAIIFDFDGVIFDSELLHYEACSHVLRPLGTALSYEEYVEHYLGFVDKEMFPRLMRNKNHFFTAEEINALIDQKVTAYTRIIQNRSELPLIEDFEEFLFTIISKVKQLGICSGSSKSEISAVFSKVGQGNLAQYFHTIVTADDVKAGKPSPEGYLLTATKLNVAPERCLVFEDTPHGIEAAKNAGMHAIGLLTTYKQLHIPNADKIATGFRQLLEDIAAQTQSPGSIRGVS
ncbi:HAD-superfamily hydrolase [Legionella birminghamensis]|uniref:HAD-superfamily hydrolase n=1 Tax=Legionella birminghamensis TaxID=28083 RepID=A0A378I7J0_9GAMM|nr:HAD family phosphatase [Legionella birminghamensis]KTC73797.1 HAD-superfamily hydrolase [Legionella birminghamensis]STX30705.1 HAD-superfamily hydrolase [Legionella birminghamensis]